MKKRDFPRKEMKKRNIERVCDRYELATTEIIALFDELLDTLLTKEEFTEKYRYILECYSLVKIDTIDPFREEASALADSIFQNFDFREIYAIKCCIEIMAIIAEQIKLRQYSLDYVKEVPKKLSIYIGIYIRRKGSATTLNDVYARDSIMSKRIYCIYLYQRITF